MKLRLEATPQELESKSGDLLKAVADIIEPVNPDMSDALVKALPRKETALKYPVLRELQRQTEALYDKTLEAMLKKIGKVLDRGFEKSEDEDDLFKALTHKYIRRVPKPGGGYRYYYRESAAARAARAGEEVRLGARMIKIVEVTEAGVVTLEEDGKQRSVKPNEWADLMATHYGDAYYAHAEKRARQAIKAVLRHVPRETLKDLRGDTDAERLDDLKKRVPDVYQRLQASFQRAGVDPFKAKQIIGHALERKSWEPEARALVIGAVLTPEGARLATHHRQIVAGAENLAGGATVQAKHVAAVIDLRIETQIEEVAKRAEEDLARLETLLSRSRGVGTDARVAAVLANALAFTSESLQKLNAYSTAFPGADDRAVAPVREALLEVQSVVPQPTTVGASTSVFVAGEGGRPKALKAQYRLMEAADVVASHSPPSFRPNADYPSGVQERAYHRDKAEQLKVLRNAKRMAAEFVVNTNPDAVNGPPIITDTGVVLGGNSRTMSMQIIYDEHPDKAAEMRKYLETHAHEVGLSQADVAAMRNPVLVRVVEVEDTSTSNLQLLVRQMNESFTQAMDPRTMQVAMGRRLGKEALDSLANAMREDETLNAFLGSNRADVFINALYRASIVDERNTNQYMKRGTRKLNSDGVTLVSRILVGRMIEDADLLSETQPSVLKAVAQSVPAMVTAIGSGDGYDLSNELRIGMDALNRLQDKVEAGTIKALDSKMSSRDLKVIMDNYFSDMFGDRHPVLDNARAQTMLEVLIRRPGPTQMAKVFREYAAMAAANPEGQAQLLGEKYTPEQVFRFSVQAAIDKEAAVEKIRVEAERAKTEVPGLFAALDPDDPDYFEKAQQLSLQFGGPFIGPRGGKWADPKHTIAWKEPKPRRRKELEKKKGIRIGEIELGPDVSLAEIESALRKQGVENVVILDARGKIKGSCVGIRHECKIPQDLIGKIFEDPNSVVTHNHPSDSFLSIEDISLGVRLDAEEIRAVVSDGVFILTRPKDGWGVGYTEEDLMGFSSDLYRAYNIVLESARKQMDTRIRKAGGVPGDESHTAFSQEVFDGYYSKEAFQIFNEWFGKWYGWEFRKEDIPTKQGGDVEAGRGAGPELGSEVQKVEKALYIGPRGGRWADAAHKIPYDEKKHGKGAAKKKVKPKGDQLRDSFLAAKTPMEKLRTSEAWYKGDHDHWRDHHPRTYSFVWDELRKVLSDPKDEDHQETVEFIESEHARVKKIMAGGFQKEYAARKKKEAKETAYEAQGMELEGPTKLSNIRGKKVWLYHGTTTKLLGRVKKEGLKPAMAHGKHSNVGVASMTEATPEYVYLTSMRSGPGSAEWYSRGAAAKHGGDPVIIRVLVDGDDLERDPDDEDIKSGATQFVTDTVVTSQIMEVDRKRLRKSEDIHLSLDEAKRLASDNRERIHKAEKVQDHTKAIADHDDIAFKRVKQVLVGKGYEASDFLENGPLYGWSTNQLIDLARDKRAG